MSKLNYKQLITKMTNEGYCNTEFMLESVGKYTPLDSDWNYKDVPHLNIVHKNVDSIQAIVDDNFVGSINFLKIPFIGITIPLIFVNYEVSKVEQIYFSSFGPFMILVKTSAIKEGESTVVKSYFTILSKKIFKFCHGFIKKMVMKNNEILMSEDIPMRDRRHALRESGHDFYNPYDTYSFKFTEEIYRANVYSNDESFVDISYKQILESRDGDIIGKSCGILSFFDDFCFIVSSYRITPPIHSVIFVALNKVSLNNNLFSGVDGTFTLSNLFVIVPVLSSAAKIPFPFSKILSTILFSSDILI